MATFLSGGGNSAYDEDAISLAVSDPLSGSFFNREFSAVSPVYFHSLSRGKYLGLFAERWHSSSLDQNGLFSSYSVDSSPSWVIFDKSGTHHSIAAQEISPATQIAHSSRSLVSACSRDENYLYFLQSYNYSNNTFGVVSHYHINALTGDVNLVGEEAIPNIESESTIVFNRGLRHTQTYLNFVGSDSSGKIYYARKNWGTIGRPSKIEYRSDKGWSEDQSTISPLRTADGGYLTTAGPVSFANYRGKVWISVVKNNDGAMTAQLYSSGDSLWDVWVPENHPYYLGIQGSTYMGGTAYLQSMLRANQSVVPPTCITGIPMVYATKVISGSSAGIKINWELWPVRGSIPPYSHSGADLSVDASLNAS